MGTRRRRLEMVAALGAALLFLGVLALIPSVRAALGHAAHGDTAALRNQLRNAGAGGVALLYAMMLSHIVLPFPSEVTNLVAGFAYGIPGGVAICMTGWLASGLGTYALGRYAGRPLVLWLIGPHRLADIEDLIERGGWPVLLALRLVPVVPFSPVGYVAGATHVPVTRFAWTSVLGSAPLTVTVVVLGSRLRTFSLADPLIWILLGSLLILLAASVPVSRRLHRRRPSRYSR